MRPGAVFFLCDLMARRYSSYVGELFLSCLNVWDVGEGFPDDVGEVGGDEQMGDFGMERVPGEECGRPVRVIFVQGAVVC